MMQRAEAILVWLATIPDWVLYLVVGLLAALENIVPPIPADVMIAVGGVAAGAGRADPLILFVAAWLANAGSALLVYALGRRYGPGFFTGRLGRFLLAPNQVDALAAAYRRFGFPIIFFSRFLPVFRPIVPVFAGVARLGFWGTAVPIILASGIWYGFLVYLGAFAGANLNRILTVVERVGGWLWLVAGVLIVAAGVWWRVTRRLKEDPGEEGA